MLLGCTKTGPGTARPNIIIHSELEILKNIYRKDSTSGTNLLLLLHRAIMPQDLQLNGWSSRNWNSKGSGRELEWLMKFN